MDIKNYFSDIIAKDLVNMMIGKKLGEGIGRDVYEYLPDPSLVIKFETAGCSFQNVMEWETWQRVRWEKSIIKWFAPCEKISACGIILLQKRTHQRDVKKYPKQLPAFLSDLKPDNYGFIGNQFVCHDYGTNLLIDKGMTKRMQKVKWKV